MIHQFSLIPHIFFFCAMTLALFCLIPSAVAGEIGTSTVRPLQWVSLFWMLGNQIGESGSILWTEEYQTWWLPLNFLHYLHPASSFPAGSFPENTPPNNILYH